MDFYIKDKRMRESEQPKTYAQFLLEQINAGDVMKMMTKNNKIAIFEYDKIGKDNKIYLSVFNPFCEQNGLVKNFNLVAFSPSGNGFLTKNLITNTTFQDDMVSAYQKTLFSRRITK